jgi:hypothetical protein
MRSKLKARWIAAIAVAAALLAIPTVAQATLVYVRNPLHPAVYAAADDGSGAHRLVPGRTPGSRRTGRPSPCSTRGMDAGLNRN